MRLTFVDESIAFDGYSASSQPLGGPEKALAQLAPALAMRGHAVEVFNRCDFPVTVEGSKWWPLDGDRPAPSDVLIAVRKAALLDFVPDSGRRVLWTGGPPAELDAPAARALLAARKPTLVFFSRAQLALWANPDRLDARVIAPGIGPDYVIDEALQPVEPARAIAVVHPLAGLDWLIRLWVERIRPRAGSAELHLYSAILDKGRLGAVIPAPLQRVLAQAQGAAPHGVVIHRPLGDAGMNDAYRRARVLLHPGFAGEMVGASLAESQAAGLPAVVRAVSPVAPERVIDRETGALAATDDQFADAAVALLTDRVAFERMSRNAKLLQRGRTWPIVAAEWEDLLR